MCHQQGIAAVNLKVANCKDKSPDHLFRSQPAFELPESKMVDLCISRKWKSFGSIDNFALGDYLDMSL